MFNLGLSLLNSYDAGRISIRPTEPLTVLRTSHTHSKHRDGRLDPVLTLPTQFVIPMPYATARWIDQNNRSHIWSGEVASRDRDQIKMQIRSQTGTKEVILQSVKG